MLEIVCHGRLRQSLNDVKSYNTIKDLLLQNIMFTTVKAQMLNKPHIHYIDVEIMNNVSRITTGLTSL
jgi:hypothetical protein